MREVKDSSQISQSLLQFLYSSLLAEIEKGKQVAGLQTYFRKRFKHASLKAPKALSPRMTSTASQ